MLDYRRGEETEVLEKAIRPGALIVPVAFELPLSGLPAGAYRLEIKAQSQFAAEPAVRTADFDVE